MTYRNQKRATSLTRRRHFREPERRFHIYCEGAKTEPAYFKALQDEFDRVQLEINPMPDPDFCDLLKTLHNAEALARQQLLARRDEKTPFGHPSTTMVCLIDAVREAQRHAAGAESQA